MPKVPAILGVHLLDGARGTVRAGTLMRDSDGAVVFTVAESYLRDPQRPILTLGWHDPTSDEGTRDRLASRQQKVAINGYLPPWFAGLLPEGALHELVLSEMGPGDHDQFDVLARLGSDLSGAVFITPETAMPASAGPLDFTEVRGFRAPVPRGVVKFSLAGVQLKFGANLDDQRLTVPGRGETGHCIINWPASATLACEAEYAAMTLAKAVGVNTAPCRLMPREIVDGVPGELLAHGENVLVVERFDRGEEGSASTSRMPRKSSGRSASANIRWGPPRRSSTWSAVSAPIGAATFSRRSVGLLLTSCSAMATTISRTGRSGFPNPATSACHRPMISCRPCSSCRAIILRCPLSEPVILPG
jgi:serine/threonine-protein kinase HipA